MSSVVEKVSQRRKHIDAGEVARLEQVVQKREAKVVQAKEKLAAAKKRSKADA